MAAFFTNLAPALESIADKVTAGQRIGDDDALALLACDDLPFLGQRDQFSPFLNRWRERFDEKYWMIRLKNIFGDNAIVSLFFRTPDDVALVCGVINEILCILAR